jgi:hypothetical protein
MATETFRGFVVVSDRVRKEHVCALNWSSEQLPAVTTYTPMGLAGNVQSTVTSSRPAVLTENGTLARVTDGTAPMV